MYIDKLSINNNYNITHKNNKSRFVYQAASKTVKKVAQETGNECEIVIRKQPFKIPANIQKCAKKLSDIVIKILDTF